MVERISKDSVSILNSFTSGTSVKKEEIWMRLRVLKNIVSSIGLLMPHSQSLNTNADDSEGLAPLKSQKISIGIEAHPALTSIRQSIGTTLYIVGSFLASHRQDDIKTAKLLASVKFIEKKFLFFDYIELLFFFFFFNIRQFAHF